MSTAPEQSVTERFRAARDSCAAAHGLDAAHASSSGRASSTSTSRAGLVDALGGEEAEREALVVVEEDGTETRLRTYARLSRCSPQLATWLRERVWRGTGSS